MKRLLLLLLASTVLPAQIKLYTANGTVETEVPTIGAFSLGSAGPGDTIQTRFRVRNVGTATVDIRNIRVAGQGFTLSAPPLSFPLAPGAPLDFTVRFSGTGSGSYSSNLTVDSISLLLLATVVPAPVLVTQSEATGGRVDLPAGTVVFLGRVQKGQKGLTSFTLENRGTEKVTVRSITVTGGTAFVYRSAVATPFEITPGGSQLFDVEFAPSANFSYTGALTIDGRSFPLTGVGYDPPLPKPAIIITGTPASGEQLKLSIRLEGPATTVANGTLRMEFKPANGAPDDAGVRFMSSGGRNLPVVTREGDDRVWFSLLQNEAIFQTGTTAGFITWTLELATHIETQGIQLTPAPAAINSATAGKRNQDLDVTVTGFDNTRSMSQALFTFYDAAGRPIAPGTIRMDVRREFDQFFLTSTTGGVFTMRATFPVQGAVSEVNAVEVEIVNSAGGSRTQRLTFSQ